MPLSMSTTGRSARILAGLGANGVTQASQLVMRLAEVPVLLMLWGAGGYGEWLLIASLPTALSFSDGGFTRTARREMAMRAGKGDATGIVAVFQSAWILLLALTVTVMLLLTTILPLMPVTQWLKLKTVGESGLVLALLALAAQVLVYFQCGLLHGAFISRGRYAIGELFIALSLVLCFCGLLVGAISGNGIVGAALGSLAGQMIGYGFMLAVHTRQAPEMRYGNRYASLLEIRKLWAPSVANLAFPLADALNMQGARLVVGLSLGPVALAVFSTTRTLCRLALQPVLSIARTVEPELSLAYGGGKSEQARRLFLQSSHAGFWVSAALSLVIAVVGPFLYRIWTNQQLDLDPLALGFMLMASVVSVLWGIALTVPCSVNRHTSLSLPFLGIYGVGSILMIFTFSHFRMSAWGAALGVLLGDALALVVVVIFALRIAGVSAGDWVKALFKSPADLSRQVRVRLRALLARGLVR